MHEKPRPKKPYIFGFKNAAFLIKKYIFAARKTIHSTQMSEVEFSQKYFSKTINIFSNV